MRALTKILSVTAVALLGVAVGTAGADVFVTGTVTKAKTKNVTETITINKTVTITPEIKIVTDSAAESQVVKNQRLEFNDTSMSNSTSKADISNGFNVPAPTGITTRPTR
jgi:hypothetical protein